MTKDLYEVLGLQKGATEDEIKSAYRKLAREFHPDRNPGDKSAEMRFKEIQEAYDVLSDKKKKEQYDRYGFAGPDMGGPGAEGGPGGFKFHWGGPGGGGGMDGIDPSDIFEGLFGAAGMGGQADPFRRARGGDRRRGRPPREHHAEVSVLFLTAAQGGSVDLQINGKVIGVKIPAGAETGQTMRLRGQGPDGGDILLKLKVESHPYFQREGKNIVLEVPISVSEAILGTRVDVPTIDGSRLTVKLPPGTSSGSRLRLRGKGIDGGDQYIQIKIVTRPPADDQSREMIEEFARRNPHNPREGLAWG
jgi:curved DNA-binding protein